MTGIYDGTVHFEDAQLLALEKPSGLLSVPGRGPERADCMASRVQARWSDALVVHRLDQATSGLMLLARGIEAQRRVSAAFANRSIHKRYQAIVHGLMAFPQTDDGWGHIDLPLIVDWPRRPRSKVDFDIGKPSQTRYRVLSHDALSRTSRLLLEPLTGRSHQLRVHLLALGHPIVGDTLYVPEDEASRLMLHACELRLQHPSDDVTLELQSPAPF